MSESLAILSWGTHGISTRAIAASVIAEMERRGLKAEEVFKTQDCHQRYVLNLREMVLPKLVAHPRFLKPKALVTLHVGNVEQYSLHEWIGMLGCVAEPKVGGIPVWMMTYSPHNQKVVQERLRQVFSPGICRTMITKTLLHELIGVDQDFEQGPGDKTRFIVPFVHFDDRHKKFSLLSRVTEEVKQRIALKHGIETTHVFRKREEFDPPKVFKPKLDPFQIDPLPSTRAEYKSGLHEFGMSIATASFESFGLFYVELLLAGVVVVFVDRPWNRLLLPDYRYRVPESRLADTVIEVWENYEEARRYVTEEYRVTLKSRFSMAKFVDTILNAMEFPQ